MDKKHKIFIIDGIFIVFTIGVLLFLFVFYRPVLNYPGNEARVTGAVLFSFDKADEILIDDNPDFTSPRRIFAEDELVINLGSGVYYWKVRSDGIFDSEIRKLQVDSEIALRIEENEGSYDLVNAGDAKLEVDIFNNGTLTGKIILDRDENKQINDRGDSFVGREN